MGQTILVSIIIPTKNEEQNIKTLLRSLRPIRQNKKWEVIIVDNFSEDKTYSYAKEWGARSFQKGPERSAQRNFGAKHAKGDVLIFLDADMEVKNRRFFEEIEKLIAGMANSSYIIPEISVASSQWDFWRAYYRKFVSNDTSVEAPRIFPKHYFQKIKGYDEKLNACEDWDIRDRISAVTPIKRIKQPILHHENINSIIRHMKKKFYYATYLPIYLGKRNDKVMRGETIYFLRSSYHKMIKTFTKHPAAVIGATLLLTLEAASGFFGFIYGKYNTR